MKPSTQSHRGRPKGTGLDDRAKLRALTEMLAADPRLKPTTAIKQLGVSDPSAIRRLRDKLKEMQAALDRTPAPGPAARSRSVALKAKAEPTFREEPAATPDANLTLGEQLRVDPPPATAVSPLPPSGNEEWLTSWLALGLKGATAAADLQRAYFDYVLKNPAATLALGQHVLANEFLLACSGAKRNPRRH